MGDPCGPSEYTRKRWREQDASAGGAGNDTEPAEAALRKRRRALELELVATDAALSLEWARARWCAFLRGMRARPEGEDCRLSEWLARQTGDRVDVEHGFHRTHKSGMVELFRLSFLFGVCLRLFRDGNQKLFWSFTQTSENTVLAIVPFTDTVPPLSTTLSPMYTGPMADMITLLAQHHLFDQCSLQGLFSACIRFLIRWEKEWWHERASAQEQGRVGVESLMFAQLPHDGWNLHKFIALNRL